MNSNRYWLALTAIVVISVVVRMMFLVQYQATPFGDTPIEDEEFYHEWAARLVAGIPGADPDVYHMSPAPARTLAAIRLVFGDLLVAVRGVHAAIGVLNALLAFAVTRRAFGAGAGLVAAAIVGLHGPAITYEASLLPLVTTVTLPLLALWLLIGSDRAPGIGAAAAAGVALGLFALLRGNGVLLIPAVGLGLLIAGRSGGTSWFRRGARAGAFALGVALAIGPVTAHNLAGGAFVPITWHGGQNFYIGNHAGATGLYTSLTPGRHAPDLEREDAIALAEKAEGRSLTPREVDRYWWRQGLGYWRDSANHALVLLARKAHFTLTAYEFPDAHDYYYLRAACPVLGPLPGQGLVLPLALVGALAAWRRSRRRARWLVGGWALYVFSVAVFFVFGRYRLPSLAFTAPLAGLGAVWLVETLRSRAWRPLAAGVSVAALGLVVAFAPTVDAAFGLASTYYNVGLVHERKAEYASAIDAYRTATGYNPRHVKSLRGLARVGLATDADPSGVLETIERAIAIVPLNPDHWVIAGEAFRRSGRTDEADRAFRMALESQPRYAPALEGLERLARDRMP